MPYYICERCRSLEKTDGGGNYWNRMCRLNLFEKDFANKKFLCRACVPSFYDEAETEPNTGKPEEDNRKIRYVNLDNIHEIIKSFNPENGQEFMKLLEEEKKQGKRVNID